MTAVCTQTAPRPGAFMRPERIEQRDGRIGGAAVVATGLFGVVLWAIVVCRTSMAILRRIR